MKMSSEDRRSPPGRCRERNARGSKRPLGKAGKFGGAGRGPWDIFLGVPTVDAQGHPRA